jgi:hypothetical protein
MTSPGEVNATIAMIKRYVTQLAQALAAGRTSASAHGSAPAEHEHGVGA